MSKLLNRFWYWQNNYLAYFFSFLAIFYLIIIKLRLISYKLNFKKTTYFPVPVIIIGNITVGGTGKTPLVIWLANMLKDQGYKPGIVSRGYGGKANYYPILIDTHSDPKKTGDEAVIISRRTNCPVMVDPSRVRAVKKLLEHTDSNIILSDDGLQHYSLGRNIEIAVIDSERKFGNGFCLPVGPLREPISRLNKIDFVINNGLEMQINYKNFTQIINAQNQQNPDYFRDKKLHAVAGIGNPKRFFNSLRSLGLNFVEHEFPDHYSYKKSDFDFGPDSIILMTEKDAVKCEKFCDSRLWYLGIEAKLPENFQKNILAKIKTNL